MITLSSHHVTSFPRRYVASRSRFQRKTLAVLSTSSPGTAGNGSVTQQERFLTTSNSRPLSSKSTYPLAHRLKGLNKPTVWHEFSPLAAQYKSINLGQGFPEEDPPPFVIQAMVQAVSPIYQRHANQYARSYAHLPLAKVLVEDYYSHRLNQDTTMDPATHVATGVGATQVMYCALQGLINPGDEVILLEPFFDIYASQVQMAGGIPVYVPLLCQMKHNNQTISSAPWTEAATAAAPTTPHHTANETFTLDWAKLENALMSNLAKVLIFNTPHNPTGKTFSRKEMERLAAMIQQHAPQITVLADEVYEHLVYDDDDASEHISLASLPGMFDRTITVSSAGKTFSATGWKVGWAVGPPHLIEAVTAVQQWVTFSAPTPNQDAMAQALKQSQEPYEGCDNFYHYLVREYKRKRGILLQALVGAGMEPIVPPGGFFIMADTSHLEVPERYMLETTPASPCPMTRDWALSRWMTQEIGVTAIPPSAFYSSPNQHLATNLLRLAFCKSDDALVEAGRRLAQLKRT